MPSAGMYRVETAAVFIKADMPPGKGGTHPAHDYQQRQVSSIGLELARNPRLGGNRARIAALERATPVELDARLGELELNLPCPKFTLRFLEHGGTGRLRQFHRIYAGLPVGYHHAPSNMSYASMPANALVLMREQLAYWEKECAAAHAAEDPARIETCERFVQQCRVVIAALVYAVGSAGRSS